MSKQALDNLVTIGRLKAEPPTRAEFTSMLESARKRLDKAPHPPATAARRLRES